MLRFFHLLLPSNLRTSRSPLFIGQQESIKHLLRRFGILKLANSVDKNFPMEGVVLAIVSPDSGRCITLLTFVSGWNVIRCRSAYRQSLAPLQKICEASIQAWVCSVTGRPLAGEQCFLIPSHFLELATAYWFELPSPNRSSTTKYLNSVQLFQRYKVRWELISCS